jgi:hypothetical protein
MGLVISKGLTLRKGYIGTDDPDAEAYIAAVEAADLAADTTAQPLETATKVAIHSFVKGAKADGFWPAIKASCILAGARTLTGALVPLAGTAPTNFNFVSGDYNRKTGLVGDGSTKHLNSNRNNNADPQNNNHNAVFISTAGTGVQIYAGAGVSSTEAGVNNLGRTTSPTPNMFFRNRFSTSAQLGNLNATGFAGTSRSSSANFSVRVDGQGFTATAASQSPYSGDWCVFGGTGGSFKTNARLAFYSVGESLNLALLDARVTDLINAFAAAIP